MAISNDDFTEFMQTFTVRKLDVIRRETELSQFGMAMNIPPSCELEMSHDGLEKLINLLKIGRLLHEDFEYERKIRESIPAAQLAYEEYKLIIKLAGKPNE